MFTSVTIAGETEPPPYLSKKDVDAAALAAQTLTAAMAAWISPRRSKSSSKTSPSDPDRLVYLHSHARYVVVEEF